ncbi:MAG: DUF4384 domain-containing protein [Cyanobacteria bacterium HKST-UBA02]|nr:DUF4384 domain-containing protein [Cyanobacteria bacterium HKST-UBA02]
MMSSRKTSLSIAMSLVLAIGFSLPGISQESGQEETGTGGKVEGAKALYREQGDKYTGLQYWIELHRNNQIQKVSNKFKFQDGDRIRFHVKSNIDGYAYILLTDGSRGEKSVLFPDESTSDDNRVKRSRDYVLPEVGYLTFDENPGNEKVTLLLSRTPINAQAYLDKPTEEPTLIASAIPGSKDLIPQKVLVAYGNPNKTFPSSSLKVKASEPEKEKAPVKKASTTSASPKNKKQPAPPKVAVKPPTKKHSGSASSGSHLKGQVSADSDADAASVTLVSSSNILHVDVDLHHI